jgi:hypothetical protein
VSPLISANHLIILIHTFLQVDFGTDDLDPFLSSTGFTEEVAALVLDNGSGMCKAGL